MTFSQDTVLGKKTTYIDQYQPDLLFPVPRALNRQEIGLSEYLPFSGADYWNAYEMSWLDKLGKPCIATAEFIFPCDSENIIESKAFKLYLNSFNQTKFTDMAEVQITLQRDLSEATKSTVHVRLIGPDEFSKQKFAEFSGVNLDKLPISTDVYSVQPDFLISENDVVEETLFSHLLRSNCLITHQPDWGSAFIRYAGKKINHAGLLKYIISFRNHNEFHEHCIERMYVDILRRCKPDKLTVYGRYTRRGGLDINPFRSNFETIPINLRSWRQ